LLPCRAALLHWYQPGRDAPVSGQRTVAAVKEFSSKRVLVALAVVILVWLYFSGSMDRLLVNIGLNYKPCAQNGLRAMMCGDQLTGYCQNLAHHNLDPGASTEDTCSKVGVTLTSSTTTYPWKLPLSGLAA
jgi:hypothetical protein